MSGAGSLIFDPQGEPKKFHGGASVTFLGFTVYQWGFNFRGGYCALVGKTENGIQNIDYELNIFGGRIPEVPDTLSGIREGGGC